MWISELSIENIKNFGDSTAIAFDKRMNLLVGQNNAGKSVILKLLFLLQVPNILTTQDIRKSTKEGRAHLIINDVPEDFSSRYFSRPGAGPNRNYGVDVLINIDQGVKITCTTEKINPSDGSSTNGFNFFARIEPENLFYPFFSSRKVTIYNENVNLDASRPVFENLSNLPAKVDMLLANTHRKQKEFNQACEDILGFQVTTFASQVGKKVGINIADFENIPLEAMGDGIPHILGLIANLCLAENKIFLIEELENDIHPKALKELLELIIKKSDINQFIISTHSNIVTRYLGSVLSSRIHNVAMEFNQAHIPTAAYKEIPNTPVDRKIVLEDLGYELVDSDIWEGWLFLEESTAETLIMKYLIPTFAPKLENRIRSISTGGTGRVEEKFEDFNRLFLFTHLTPIYHDKTWVLLDGDTTGNEVITRLKSKYPSWNQGNFRNFSKHSIEEYYPSVFVTQVTQVLSMPHGQNKQDEKSKLSKEVMDWIDKNSALAKTEFKISAAEILTILKEIEGNL